MRRGVLLAMAVGMALTLGVRSGPSRATPWVKSEFKGPARAVLLVRELGASGEAVAEPLEVYSAMTYGTEVSGFDSGILLKTMFAMPRSQDHATLIIDLERRGSRTVWSGGEPRQLRARYYVAGDASGAPLVDAEVVSGELRLDAIAIAHDAIGFRIRGWLELVDRGPDGRVDTADDRVIDLEIALETLPPPEAVAAGRPQPSSLPVPSYCEWPDCYEDADYTYDPYHSFYTPACGDVGVGYSYYDYDEASGCHGDPYVDGAGDDFDEPGWDEDVGGGCDGGGPYDEYDYGDDSSGCGGDTGGDSGGCGGGESNESSSGGCEGSDSGSSSGGCEGDTLDGSPRGERLGGAVRLGELGWLGILALAGLVLGVHRRRY